jgi:hypothetical protein
VTNQRKCLKRSVDFAGDIAPQKLTPELLTEWRDHLRAKAKLKDSSINTYLLTVGTFLNWLVDEGVLLESPMMSVPLLKRVTRGIA